MLEDLLTISVSRSSHLRWEPNHFSRRRRCGGIDFEVCQEGIGLLSRVDGWSFQITFKDSFAHSFRVAIFLAPMGSLSIFSIAKDFGWAHKREPMRVGNLGNSLFGCTHRKWDFCSLCRSSLNLRLLDTWNTLLCGPAKVTRQPGTCGCGNVFSGGHNSWVLWPGPCWGVKFCIVGMYDCGHVFFAFVSCVVC